MILKAYAVRDTKSEIYNAPFFQKTHGEAERSFKQLANDTQSMVGRYPEDFDLYYVGEYDDQTGKFKANAAPEHIIKAVELRDRQNNQPLNQVPN